ncbi:hypothetical protein Tcan_15146 [Toxocara canis]|uniref:Uncharacterized protein n=1 Tax=Toxocara canis TaxID=6265 RepID=A0A0B2V845_TOXCA|nr:hypothetical protein Tcan_15146 [Toxocara canis]
MGTKSKEEERDTMGKTPSARTPSFQHCSQERSATVPQFCDCGGKQDPGSVENGNEASAYQLSRPQMTLFMDPAVSGQHDCVRRLVGSPDFFSTSGGRITPSEMIHNYGLERSLSATYSDKAILDLLPGSTAPAGSPQVLKAYPQRFIFELFLSLSVCSLYPFAFSIRREDKPKVLY